MKPPSPPPRQPTLLEQTVTALALDQHARTQLLHQAAALNIHHDDPAIVLLGAREAIRQEMAVLKAILDHDRMLREQWWKEQLSLLPKMIWGGAIIIAVVSVLSFFYGSQLYYSAVSKHMTWTELAKNVGLHLMFGLMVIGLIAGAVRALFCIKDRTQIGQ